MQNCHGESLCIQWLSLSEDILRRFLFRNIIDQFVYWHMHYVSQNTQELKNLQRVTNLAQHSLQA